MSGSRDFRIVNQFAVEIPTLPVDQRYSHLIQILVECWAVLWECRAATMGRQVYLVHAWILGNVFANPTASSSATCPQQSNPWISKHTSPHVMSESQTPAQDRRCQSGPSVRNSFVPSEGDSFNNYGADQQRLQISDPHFDKFTTSATFACWKIRFETEVCTCSQLPT